MIIIIIITRTSIGDSLDSRGEVEGFAFCVKLMSSYYILLYKYKHLESNTSSISQGAGTIQCQPPNMLINYSK